MMFKSRSREELEPLVEAYLNGYYLRTGLNPDPAELAERIRELAVQKEAQAFHASFGTLGPNDLQLTAKILEEMRQKPEEEVEVQPPRQSLAVELTSHELESGKKPRKRRARNDTGPQSSVTQE
jgi:hypothetical protein